MKFLTYNIGLHNNIVSKYYSFIQWFWVLMFWAVIIIYFGCKGTEIYDIFFSNLLLILVILISFSLLPLICAPFTGSLLWNKIPRTVRGDLRKYFFNYCGEYNSPEFAFLRERLEDNKWTSLTEAEKIQITQTGFVAYKEQINMDPAYRYRLYADFQPEIIRAMWEIFQETERSVLLRFLDTEKIIKHLTAKTEKYPTLFEKTLAESIVTICERELKSVVV